MWKKKKNQSEGSPVELVQNLANQPLQISKQRKFRLLHFFFPI